MWWMVVTSGALAKAPPKEAPMGAVARWSEGEIVVQLAAGAPSCELADGEEARRLSLRRTDDGKGWSLAQVDVRTEGGASGVWYAEGEHLVTGLGGTAKGAVDLVFAEVPVELDDGVTTKVAGPVHATWCGRPLGSVIAEERDGGVVLQIDDSGVLHACGEGHLGDRELVLWRYIDDDASGWGVQSVMEAATGAVDDYFVSGASERPVKGVGAGPVMTLSFAPLTPGPDSGRTTTVTGPLDAVWCGAAAPPTVGADAAGAGGAWMGVGGRWFEVKGARWSPDHGLELSTLELTCDRMFHYMDEDVSMSLETKGKELVFWSVSGKLVAPPRSWNGKAAAPKLEGDRVDFGGLSGVSVGALGYELRGSVPVVRCPAE
ncbi:MAG: hypothetical protein H6735_06540 [Alphaproteobacteria bacterium]|nr:hypothetical protein [Alphaproteobacteria bacterium]